MLVANGAYGKPMDLSDLITPYGVIPALKAGNKKQVLQELSARAAKLTGIDEHEIFNILLQRERLGSTGIGNGIAIPHGKMSALTHIVGLFARLEEPIDFDAIDEEPVDLVFLLLAPENAGADHLKALARISRLMREPAAVEKLRSSREKEALYAVLTEPAASHAA
jgi:nitrogen PTS system EIIA component